MRADTKYPRKVDMAENSYDWVCNPSCEEPGRLERLLIDNREDVEVLAEMVDSEACYAYDEIALVRYDGKLYLLHTVGCSCPSPTETWRVHLADTTVDAVKAMLKNGSYPGGTYPKEDVEHFFKQLTAVTDVA